LLSDLHSRWVEINFTTLHVGLWTFKPVYEQDIRNHKIHREPIIIEDLLFQQIYERKKENKNLIAVWTTMVRLLETLPYLRKSLSSAEKERILSSIDAFNFWESISSKIQILDCEKFVHNISLQSKYIVCETQLFIFPWRKFRLIDEMITNFHLPKSSLLMLISALMWRENALRCYEYAKQNWYYFYSFWDWMWIRK
jgi:S-adenosylmethionine:tRNA ribosyltransferase-isomerase